MLLTTSTDVKLNWKYNKILHFCPTYNNTYVMLAIKSHRIEVLSHLDNQGRVIKQKIFYDADLQEMGMISSKQVILLHTKQNMIIQWNIETNITIQVPYLFKDQQSIDACYLYLFSQTQTFCIVETGNHESNLFRLSYFNYPIQNAEAEPFLVFDDDQVWNYKHIVRKANDHSMICWFQNHQDFEVSIKAFDFRDNPEGEYNIFELEQCNKTDEQFKQMDITLGNLWEIRPQEFILICITNEEKKYPNGNFIFNVKNYTIRKALFTFDGKFQNQITDTYCFGVTSMFRGYDYEKGIAKTAPIYYINNQTQEIIAQEEWECSHLSKYEFLAHTSNILIQCEYENGHVDFVVVKTKQILNKKLIYASFILGLIEDSDEDLIYEVIHLATSS